MGHLATSRDLDAFVSGLFEEPRYRRAMRVITVVAWSVAIGSHLLAGGLMLTEPRAFAATPPPPLEVALLPPEPAAQSEPPTPPPLPEPPEQQRPSSPEPASAAPPEPARAGALLTAKAEDPSGAADEPVDFTNDPTTLGFGSGVVAIGGKAEVGRPDARPAVATPSVGGLPAGRVSDADSLTPAADLGRKPSLGESDPCRGYFPAGASDDAASASVNVVVAKSGAVSSVRLLSESPPKQGFGAAARACMLNKRFTPALDRHGHPAATAVRVNVRFSR